MFDLVMAQFSGGGTIISNLFQGRLQYAAGMSIVNIKPKQLGICFVLFMVIFGDNQTRIHHTLQIPPTMETHKATQTLFYFLATGRTHPHRSTHTHTHMQMRTRINSKPNAVCKLSRTETVQVTKGATVQSVETQGEIQLNFFLQRKCRTHNITFCVQIPLCCHKP